jgi:hypothetical protein
MSTDYGFKCVDCDEKRIIDNARGYAVATLQSIIENIDSVNKVRTMPDLEISSSVGWTGLSEAIDFVAMHVARGHKVRVTDEYGRLEGQCQLYAKCGECGAARQCALEINHAPPCSPVKPGYKNV